MPNFGKFLALIVFLYTFFFRPVFAQETFFFQEEFNLDRPGGQLDPGKWTVYENRPPLCSGDLVKESGGFLTLIQCSDSKQFPYIVSKNDPFPSENFTATIKFQYTNVRPWGTGIQLVDTAPENGVGFTSLFGIGVWEDNSILKMRLNFKEQIVYTAPINSSPHEFKLEKMGSIYKLSLDDQLVFTSPETSEKIHSIYMGNPSIQAAPPFPGWTWFKVDYIRVTDDGSSETTPQPFLDLPWDYEANGMTFNEAAMSMSAYFDHEYPLLSAGFSLAEPIEAQNTIISLNGGDRNEDLDYSKHDGYDYANRAQVKLNRPLLAPAEGEATFMSSCGACGNAILIDHKNGFQTRYYHMQPDGLITSTAGQKVNVTKGQQIGKVGYTGNVHPSGEQGSHLHFMVIQDKNGDGNFEDNIPDGITDPFGWQSEEPDPWENYSFNYAGQQRTGNKSYYLFTKPLDNLNANLTSNAAIFNVGKTKLEFPQGTTDQSLSLSINSAPNFTNLLLNSLGSIAKIEAKNPAGQFITTFLKNFSLTISFSQFDLTRYNLDTLSIYSSPDGENWTKEDTQVDLTNKIATTSINHLTYFALMAERKDTIAPTTTPVLEGEKGTANNFRSDVNVSLNAQDNEGGLGIEFTAYGLEDEDWQTYTTPLTFSEEGTYKIHFYSQDKDENIEEIKTLEFSIDKTAPEAKIEVDQGNWDLKVSALEDEDVEITKTPNPKNKATYTLTDPAGNTLTLESYDLNYKHIDIFKLYSLKYNNDPKITLPDNLFDTNYIFYTPKNRPEIKIINQNFFLKNQASFIIVADALKQKTVLNILENGVRRKEEKPGIVLLKLQTNKGKLEYLY